MIILAAGKSEIGSKLENSGKRVVCFETFMWNWGRDIQVGG